MQIQEKTLYQKAFIQYLRRGIPIDVSLKAMVQQPRLTTHYIWRTSGDGKVRPAHAANEGKIFAWDNPPATGHPGEDYNCRCRAEPYYDPSPDDPPIEAVYPEFLLIPLLRIPRLVIAWRAWMSARNTSRNWQLSPTKSEIKWRNRIEKGDWTPNKITNTIRYGARFKVKNERTGGSATRYEYNGKYLVRDDETGNVLQLSASNHIPKEF